MKDSRILSSFQELPHAEGARPLAQMPELVRVRDLVFDTCKAGVVLRAVLFVQAIAAVAGLFGATTVWGWLTQMALFTGAALPATLVWLLTVCALKKPLDGLPIPAQWTAGMALGALAALYGCGLLVWMGLADPAPWLGSAASGALVAAVLVAALVWRTKARAPAGATAQLAELQARIRPHFLFNTLNTAIALVREEPAKAENLLEDLSELFRHALADTKEAVPLRQELELAEHYLAIEQLRFGERLKVEWSLDEAASKARLPPLILQPLVENAVKHGVEPSPGGAMVRISTQRRGSVVVIKVTNTVPAGSGRRGHGLALDNVRQRLTLLHDVQGRFQSALVNGVFQVRLEIPI
ncbi:MAG: sensor histidine kinase [Hydrogenophaga sp.]|uniref:sensor histidine kinase n=1 Tax=Hydrogenophaga sp. TaxID=1904254 RepID=UPI001BBE7CA5|nr:sensor histidine kinase [Hydrogenophaga sp.]MBS3910748.1 sensor histidine kinase [Hydrogenophaga sp.]MDO9133775.1 sensor histidine kinase [Hydrogenophaga sp.]MDO9604075.1 sensor histidine kinase [Hydrogenophaga sp.]MDP2163500.1 sensor histidine kinase [Hydrogenophaga sp.]MDP3478034.1 sensor histidine kinase [Hydrogenophaga sp.]